MTLPTISNIYLFDRSLQDTIGGNDLTGTNISATDYVKGIIGYAVDLDGSTEYVQAANNTIYDVTTGDFWVFGFLKPDIVTGDDHALVAKRDLTAATNPGYIVEQFNTVLYVEFCDGSASRITMTVNSAFTAGIWHAWGVSFDRDGSMAAYVKNMNTGVTVSGSVAISAQQASATNTQIFTYGRRSDTSGYFLDGKSCYFIPPQSGTMTQTQFDEITNTPRLCIHKRDGTNDDSITYYEARNFSSLSKRFASPAEAVGDIVGNEQDAILIKALGPTMQIGAEWTVLTETSTPIYDPNNSSTDVNDVFNYLTDTLASTGTDQIKHEYTLTIYRGNDKSTIKDGAITTMDLVQTADQPLTYRASLGFQVGIIG